jgi:hypothetical protein
MKKLYLIILLAAFYVNMSHAQDSLAFKPTGRIIARGFFDYSSGLGKMSEQTGFDITRAFLGYGYQFSPTLQGQVIIDGASGKTSADRLEVYLRNAFINWRDEGFNINIGQTGLMQFSIQERYWMYRYVMRSFQDLNGMSPSVDLGFTAEYEFNPYISADLSLTNGAGHRRISKSNSARYAAGLSLHPTNNTILRVYTDVYNESENMRDALPAGVTDASYKNQYSLSLFAGYQDKTISGGLEYNRIYNKGFIGNRDYFGYSIYASGKFAPKWRSFARYDLVDSRNPATFTTPWNRLDGQVMVFGFEFQPVKQLRIAPNFRNINPDRAKSEQYLFVNVEFAL